MNTLPNTQTQTARQIPTQRIAQPQTSQVMPGENLVHNIDDSSQTGRGSNSFIILLVISFFVIAAGSGTGYILANLDSTAQVASDNPAQSSSPEGTTRVAKTGEEGINDDELFPDEAEGELKLNDGSLSKEGTHMLIREGGPDKTAFLTSSVIDLTKYEGKRVTVKGQTLSSQTAGWFMDVGWIKVL